MICINVKIYPSCANAIGLSDIFWIHSGICVVLCTAAIFIIPETQGKTLTELSVMYSAKIENQDRTKVPSRVTIYDHKKSED